MSPELPIPSTSKLLNPKGGDSPKAKPPIPDHELIRCIGEGAYGEVWLARNVLGTYRAVKIVYRKSFRDERTYEREFRGIQQFEPVSRTNDGLLDILQAGRNDDAGHYYYVMELADDAAVQGSGFKVQGSKLDAVESEPRTLNLEHRTLNLDTYTPRTLSSEIQHQGRLPPAECVQLGLNLTLALGHLHRHGLIHRDIKPANIIFVQAIPKLADIGLVTTFDDTCSFVGTEGFIAPEGPTSPRADLFSLGKVLYEISTGKDRKDFPEPPTGLGENSDAQNVAELNAVILKACAADPSDRYQTAEEFHADLALLNSGKSVMWKRVVEKRLAFARKAGAVVAIIAALATGAYLFQRHQTREAIRLKQVAEELVTRMQIQNAENHLQRGDSALGLAHLAQVLRRDPDNRVAAERIMAALTQRNFPRLVTRPLLHTDKLITAHFSPDGQSIVSASEDHTVRIWNAQTGQETVPALKHSQSVNSVEFSPDGSKVLTASTDGTACVLDAPTGALLFPPLKHEGSVNDAAFSPNSRWIATAARDSKARIYSVETGQVLYSLAHEGGVRSVAFSSDGQWLATASADDSVRVWEVSSGQLKHCFKPDETISLAVVRFSEDGKSLAAILKNDEIGAWQVQVWEAGSGRPVTKPLHHPTRIYSLAFSPDNRRIVTAGGDNVARVWQVATGELIFQLHHSAIVYSAAFSPDGRQILTASVDHTARLWDAATGAVVSEPMLHDGRTIHAEFSPDGKRVLTAGWDKTVKLWDVRPAGSGNKTLPHDFWVMSAEFDSTGNDAITATCGGVFTANNINSWKIGRQHAVVVWDVAAGARKFAPIFPRGREALAAQFLKTGPKALMAVRNRRGFSRNARIRDVPKDWPSGEAIQHDDEIHSAHFSADGLKLATGSADGTARVWDARHGVALTPPLVHTGTVSSVRFSPDGNMLITGGEEGTAMIWDAVSGKCLAPPLRHDAEVWFAQFSSQGDKIVTVSLDYSARIWSTNGARLAVLQHSAPVEHAEFSPDGTQVVTASGDRTARLWSVTTGKQLTEPLEHKEVVLMARFSPDGLRVITASMDRTAQLWDVATSLKLADPFRHSEWVVSACFSPDGRQAITASLDQTAKIWEVPTATSPIPPWLAELAEAVGGQRLNADRIPEPVSWTEYIDLKAQLTKSPAPDLYVQWARRFFDDRATENGTSTLPVPLP